MILSMLHFLLLPFLSCMDLACSIYPSSVNGHIDSSHHLSVICNVAMNIVYKFCVDILSFFLVMCVYV